MDSYIKSIIIALIIMQMGIIFGCSIDTALSDNNQAYNLLIHRYNFGSTLRHEINLYFLQCTNHSMNCHVFTVCILCESARFEIDSIHSLHHSTNQIADNSRFASVFAILGVGTSIFNAKQLINTVH